VPLFCYVALLSTVSVSEMAMHVLVKFTKKAITFKNPDIRNLSDAMLTFKCVNLVFAVILPTQ